MHDGQICLPYPGGKVRLAHPRASRYTHADLPARRRRSCTSRPGSARPSCRSASSRGPRRPSSFCEPASVDCVRVAPRVSGLTGATLVTAPAVCHDCVWWQSRSGPGGRQGPLARADRGGVGPVGDALLRRRRPSPRLDAVRASGDVPARRRAAGRTTVGRRAARHLRLPRRALDAVGHAVAVPGRHRRRARQGCPRGRGLRLPLPRGHVVARALRRHRTIFPHDFLADFGFQVVRSRGPSSSRGSSWAASCPSGGLTREGHGRAAGDLLPASRCRRLGRNPGGRRGTSEGSLRL